VPKLTDWFVEEIEVEIAVVVVVEGNPGEVGSRPGETHRRSRLVKGLIAIVVIEAAVAANVKDIKPAVIVVIEQESLSRGSRYSGCAGYIIKGSVPVVLEEPQWVVSSKDVKKTIVVVVSCVMIVTVRNYAS